MYEEEEEEEEEDEYLTRFKEFEIEEEELDLQQHEQSENERVQKVKEEEIVPEIKSDISKKRFKSKIGLEDPAHEEFFRSQEPSYTNMSLPFTKNSTKRLAERMEYVRKLLKYELEKIKGGQKSAFESVRIRRLYKTGIRLPERIFLDHEAGYTFKETERLRFLMNNDVF